MTSKKKREIAVKLLEGHSGWYPEHYGNKKSLNDSRLCRFNNETESVLIAVKCLEWRMKKPCIGLFFNSQTKSLHLEDLRNLRLPAGFKLNEDAITPNLTGWVEFCRADDCSEDRMYSEIVASAERREEWKSLFEVLRQWAVDKISGETHYGQEKGALLQIVDTSLPSIAATRPDTALALWGRARLEEDAGKAFRKFCQSSCKKVLCP